MKQTAWVKKVDSTPTQNSENLIESGGVFNAINGKNLKTYYLGSQLGLTGGDYKPLDIVKALPDHSIFVSAPTASYGDLANVGTGTNEWIYNGTVLVFKDNPERNIVLNFYGTASNSSIQKFAVSRAYVSSGSSTYDAMTPWTVYDDGSSLAIVAAGTTAPRAIASGQYVVWQGSLYTAQSNIASGATLSTSNLTAVSNGGLNALKSEITGKFSSRITSLSDLNTVVARLESGERTTVLLDGSVANTLIDHNAAATALLTKMDSITADMIVFSLGGNYVGTIRYNTSSGVTKEIELAQKSEINTINSNSNQVRFANISSAATGTIESLGVGNSTYGSYFLLMRIDSSNNGAWAGFVRHNASGYQVSEVYKGEHAQTPYVDSNGIVKTSSTTPITVHAYYMRLSAWN